MSDFEIAREGTQARVTVGGKLTAVEAPALQEALRQELGAGVREVVLDLGATRSLDSTGIGLLVAIANSLAAVGGTVRLLEVGPEIMKLLRAMRLAARLNAAAAEAASHG
jgi:anti-sigma B factor antagonist